MFPYCKTFLNSSASLFYLQFIFDILFLNKGGKPVKLKKIAILLAVTTLSFAVCACSAPQAAKGTAPEPTAPVVAPESTDEAQKDALVPTANLSANVKAFYDAQLADIKAIFESDEVADHTYTLLYSDEKTTLISAESGICIIRHGEKGDEFGYFNKVLRGVYDPTCIASGDGKYLALSGMNGAYLIDIENNTLSEIYMTDSKLTPDSLQKSILMPHPNILGWKGDALLIDYPFENSAEHTANDPAHCCFSIDAKTREAAALSEEPTDIEPAPQYDKETANAVISKYFKLFEENLND